MIAALVLAVAGIALLALSSRIIRGSGDVFFAITGVLIGLAGLASLLAAVFAPFSN
jgi:hypothetical protein